MSTDYKNEFGGWVIRFRWWIILFAIVLVFAAASGARFLGFSTDYRVFFSKDNPQLVAFETLQNTYTKNDNIMFAVCLLWNPKTAMFFHVRRWQL